MMEDLMTSRELAVYLKIDLRTVYRYLKQGRIPRVRVGNRWRFRRSDIDAWLRREGEVEQLPPSPAKHILVVEDNPGTVELLIDILQGAGYNVQAAHTAEEALSVLQEISYDLLMVDLKLPKMGGLTLISRAQTLYAGKAKCIILTGHASKENAVEAMNLGVRKFLEKPFSVSQLLATVESALQA